jgi:hypothetical protein
MDEHTLTAPSDIPRTRASGARASRADGGCSGCGNLRTATMSHRDGYNRLNVTSLRSQRRGGPAADLAEAVGQHGELLGRQDVDEQFADQSDVAGGGLLLELSRASASSVMRSSPSGAAASRTRISYCEWDKPAVGTPRPIGGADVCETWGGGGMRDGRGGSAWQRGKCRWADLPW